MAAAVAMSAYAARRLPTPSVGIAASRPSEPLVSAAPPLPDVVVEAEVEPPAASELPLAEPWPPVREAAAWVPAEAPLRPAPRQPTRERVRAVAATPEPVAASAVAEARAFVEAVRCADNEPPRYPEHDRRAGHEGIVIVTAAIAADGTVVNVALRVPSPFPGLNREALRAVRGWRFEPARRDGVAVDSALDVTIEFRLRAGHR